MLAIEQALKMMEEDFSLMSEAEKNMPVAMMDGQQWSPAQIMAEVHKDSELGKRFVSNFAKNIESLQALQDLLILQQLMSQGRVVVMELPLADDGYEDEYDLLPPPAPAKDPSRLN